MHKYASRWPIFLSTCACKRYVATVKARNWTVSPNSVPPQPSTSSKWYLPDERKNSLPSTFTRHRQDVRDKDRLSDTTKRTTEGWHRRPSGRPHSSDQKASIRPNNNYRRNQDDSVGRNPRPLSKSTRHAGEASIKPNNNFRNNQNDPMGQNLRPLFKLPTADALSKWTRQAEPTKPTTERKTVSSTGTLETGASGLENNYDIDEDNPRGSSDTKLRNGRDGRKHLNRTIFKARRSLLSNLNTLDDKPASMRAKAPVQRTRAKDQNKRKPTMARKANIYIPTTVSVRNLARLLNVRLDYLQRRMRRVGMADEASYDHQLTADYAALIAEEFGRNPIISDEAAFDIHPLPPHPNPTSLPTRPPVVAIMGHVDHGKTTLLDTLRSSSVAKGEAGGITQHIGAFSVPVHENGKDDARSTITFLDTPGHAAFSAMRARGAHVTDIIVLVVAADDGVKPQTREVINLINNEEGKVGVVVAINKVDKPGIDIENVQRSLLAENLSLETFGGDVPCVGISGLTGQGLPELVETISTMAEMQDLRAEHDGPVHGYVLESEVQKGLGPVATVLILRGQIQTGSHIISGTNQAKVRLMKDATGASIKVAHPGMAVTVSGWKTLPNAGDEVLQGTEAEIKKAIANRERKAELDSMLVDVDAININRREEKDRRSLGISNEQPVECDDGPKELRLVVKADVSGSVEAVLGAIQGIGNDKVIAKIVFSAVGDVSEADVMMAKAVGGTIIGFSVTTPRVVQALAARNGVPICTSNVIYKLMDDVKQKLIDLLPVSVETAVTGEATVLQLFEIQIKAKETKQIAGCRVTNGIVEKTQLARVVRDGSVIHEGRLDTMRQLKKDVMEVRKGSECGLGFCEFSDLRQGDLIQMYKCIEKPGVL